MLKAYKYRIYPNNEQKTTKTLMRTKKNLSAKQTVIIIVTES